ncbi:hypothetical protein IJT17_05265 [bacterium]|nr:hypothetical protein [bacterium]
MKKFFAMAIASALLLSLGACTKTPPTPPQEAPKPAANTAAPEANPEQPKPEEPSAQQDGTGQAGDENKPAGEEQPAPPSDEGVAAPQEQAPDNPQNPSAEAEPKEGEFVPDVLMIPSHKKKADINYNGKKTNVTIADRPYEIHSENPTLRDWYNEYGKDEGYVLKDDMIYTDGLRNHIDSGEYGLDKTVPEGGSFRIQ